MPYLCIADSESLPSPVSALHWRQHTAAIATELLQLARQAAARKRLAMAKKHQPWQQAQQCPQPAQVHSLIFDWLFLWSGPCQS